MDARPPGLLTSGEARQERDGGRPDLVQTQFGNRLILLSTADAHDLILPEGKDEEHEETGARGGPMATQETMDQEERKDAMQLERRALEFCREVEISNRRAESWRRAGVRGTSPYENRGRVRAATRSILVGIITMLTTSLANLPGTEGFKAYDCSNSSNPVEMYSLSDPEPCPDVALDHVVERVLHGEIVQMKRERLIRIARCHVVESVLSQYCGWQSRAGVVR
jgi:hypothetical protein